MSALRPGAVLAGTLAVAAACGGAEAPDPHPVGVSVRDSLGVVIVEHPAPMAAAGVVWKVDLDSAVQIGRLEGDHEYLFGRIAGFARLHDGRIAVADAMGPWIRVYEADGTYAGTIGGPGDGPNEFANLVRLLPYVADSLLVVDYEGARWTVLDPDGRYVRSQRPEVRGWDRPFSPALHGVFADGTFLLGEFRSGGSPLLTPDQEVGVVEDSVRFFRSDPSGEVLAGFGTRVSERSFMARIDGRTYSWDGQRAGAFWAAHGERFYYADAERFEVQIFRGGGELDRVIRVRMPVSTPPPLPPEHLENPVFAELYRRTPRPLDSPAFSDLLLDEEGNLWVREFLSAFGAAPTARWFVYAPDGTLRATVQLPSGFRASWRRARDARMVVGRDHILAVAPGALGVETLSLMPLRRD